MYGQHFTRDQKRFKLWLSWQISLCLIPVGIPVVLRALAEKLKSKSFPFHSHCLLLPCLVQTDNEITTAAPFGLNPSQFMSPHTLVSKNKDTALRLFQFPLFWKLLASQSLLAAPADSHQLWAGSFSCKLLLTSSCSSRFPGLVSKTFPSSPPRPKRALSQRSCPEFLRGERDLMTWSERL